MSLSLGLGLALTRNKGGVVVPNAVTVNGVTYGRLVFKGEFLDRLISSQPLYGRV